MDMKTVLCFMTDMKKETKMVLLACRGAEGYWEQCVSLSFIELEKNPKFIFMYVKSKLEELDRDFRQNK